MDHDNERFVLSRTKTMPPPGNTSAPNKLWITIPTICSAVLVGLFLVPWMPSMPSVNHESWEYALNEAVARHLVFGRDFVFTFGPLGSVFTHLYNPATDMLMLVGSSLIAVGLCTGSVLLLWGRGPCFLLLPPFVIVGTRYSADACLMALPLLLLLVTFRVSSPAGDRLHLRSTPWTNFGVSLLSCAVGILPLIKVTLLGLTIITTGLAVLAAFVGQRKMIALYIVFFATISLCVGWITAKQPLLALPHFFWEQMPIMAGYSEAMSVPGANRFFAYWAVATVFIAVFLGVLVTRRRGLMGCLIFLGFALYSLATFKEGFVRQFPVSAESFLFIGLFLMALQDPLPAVAVAVISVLGWGAIERSIEGSIFQGNPRVGIGTVLADIGSRARVTMTGLILRMSSSETLGAMFKQANEDLRKTLPLPKVEGSADFYPDNEMFLFANRITWNGRPIPASYAAYTLALAKANAAHLLVGRNPPTNIFFAVRPIDERLPALEDSLSWPLLLSRYFVADAREDYLQMPRRAQPTSMMLDARATTVSGRVNEWVDLPLNSRLVWTSIDMHPTLLGKLVLIAYKLPEVQVDLRLANGQTVRHRYIPEMGKLGFLLSPYVGSTADFALMAAGRNTGEEVRQIKIETSKMGLWPKRISLSFRKLEIPPERNLRHLVLAEPRSPPAVITAGEANQLEDCSLDAIGGRVFASLKQPIPIANDHVILSGWTAPGPQRGIGPDDTWISLTGKNGKRRFYRAKQTPHPDIRASSKQPGLKDPGFSADLDVSELSGTQTITIYSTNDAKAYRCSQGAVLDFSPENAYRYGSAGR